MPHEMKRLPVDLPATPAARPEKKLPGPFRGVRLLLAWGLLALPVVAAAQNGATAGNVDPQFPVRLDKRLEARATNFTEVSLNKNMLNFASKFLNSQQKNDVQAQHLIQKLNGVYVRTYNFGEPGDYTAEDLQAIRKQFLGPEWNPMVRERSKKGQNDTDVYLKMVDGEIQGMFVLDAEPRELDLVYISGPIRPEDLQKLSGNFGIPNVNVEKSPAKGSGGASK